MISLVILSPSLRSRAGAAKDLLLLPSKAPRNSLRPLLNADGADSGTETSLIQKSDKTKGNTNFTNLANCTNRSGVAPRSVCYEQGRLLWERPRDGLALTPTADPSRCSG